MFNKPIIHTSFTSEMADILLPNIKGYSGLDSTFLTTLRILLHSRLSKDETVILDCCCLDISKDELINKPVRQQLLHIVPINTSRFFIASYGIQIVYAKDSDTGETMLDILESYPEHIKNLLPNYSHRNDLRVFYARKMKSLFFTDNEGKHTIIFVSHLDIKHYHALQMMTPKYLPFLFEDKDAPLSENEILLLKSLGNKSAVEYERLLSAFEKELDFRETNIRIKLSNFEKQFEYNRISEIKNQIKIYQDDYDRSIRYLREISLKIQEYQYTLAGLECSINNKAESELMEYFICNKNLILVNVNHTIVEFIVHGYADLYDIEGFLYYVSLYNGYMYRGLSPLVSKSQMEILYRALFEDNDNYKLRMCAAFKADMQSNLRGVQHYPFSFESQNYLPNPHIYNYGCIGDYAGKFQEYLKNNDYVGAIEQAVLSTRNLNFYDSSVIPAFATILSSTTIQCIEKLDGTLLTPKQVIDEIEGGTQYA